VIYTDTWEEAPNDHSVGRTLHIVGLYFDFFYQPASDDTPSMSLRFSWVGIPACAPTSPLPVDPSTVVTTTQNRSPQQATCD
jgi:hypothetical protein